MSTASDRDAIISDLKHSLELLHEPGSVVEIRALDVGKIQTVSGYFDNFQTVAEMCYTLTQNREASAVYHTLNAVDPSLLARAANRTKDWPKCTTSDKEIIRRNWLFLDLDPSRFAGIGSTNEQHAEARRFAAEIEDDLRQRGWPYPINQDSGNGWYLLYKVDLPNDDETTKLLKAFYQGLAKLTKDYAGGIQIDPSVCNAARIARVGGTWNRKGDSTADRPHRQAEVFPPVADCPVDIVPIELIRQIADLAPQPKPNPASKNGSSRNGSSRLLVNRYLTNHNIAFKTKQIDGGTAYLITCLFDQNHGGNGESSICQANSGLLTYHCKHASCQDRKWSEAKAAIGEPDPEHWDPPKGERKQYSSSAEQRGDARQDLRGKLKLVRLDTVIPRPINWLWKDRFASGKVTLFAGDAGNGKSMISTSIAASITKGWKWPDGAPGCEPGNVLILAAEDGLEDTLQPRLAKAGADLSKIIAAQGVEYDNPDIAKRVFNLRADAPYLINALREVGDVKLLIIDPVSSYLDGIDTNKNGDVRSALQPLVETAEEHGTAVLIVTHLSKASARSALSAATGSLAFGALARQAHLAIPDPDDQSGERRLFLCMKSNICRKPSGLAYTIGDDGIQWFSEPVRMDPDEALRRANQIERKTSKSDAAKDWLGRLGLDKRAMPAAEVRALAEDAGITYMTLKRAFDAMGGVAQRGGFQGGTTWQIPDISGITSHTFQDF